MATIGEKVRRRREELELTQTELAHRAQIPQPRLSAIERDIKTDLSLSTAKRLAKALGVGIDYLAGTWEVDENAPHGHAVILAP